jgi:hypothetical protein
MSRTLYRPMFRRGGSTGEGITSGLRRGYAFGSTGSQRDYLEAKKNTTPTTSGGDSVFNFISEPPPLPKSSAGADFWLNLGTNILAQPGGRPILQTLGMAGKEPVARYQQQRAQEDLLKYKHGQSERQFHLEWYKALSDKDKHALQEKIDYLVDEFGLTPEEALKRALPEFRKPRHPDEQKLLDTEYERDQLDKEIERIQIGLSSETEYISKEQAAVIHNFYEQAKDQGWRYEADTPYIDLEAIKEEWRAAGKKQDDWLSPEGNIAISPDEQKTYTEGLYYVDSFTGDVYQVGPGSTELIKIDLSEIKIN